MKKAIQEFWWVEWLVWGLIRFVLVLVLVLVLGETVLVLVNESDFE